MSEGDGVRISINNLEGLGKREIVISGLNESESEGFLEFLKERGWGEPEPESGRVVTDAEAEELRNRFEPTTWPERTPTHSDTICALLDTREACIEVLEFYAREGRKARELLARLRGES